MSRRTASAIAITAIVSITLVGCAAGSATSTGELSATTPEAVGPLESVSWNLPAGEPVSLDYSLTWDTASGNTVLANLCDTLVRQDPSGEYTPALASAVTNPNPTTYVYEIRDDARFTNGDPVTAEDVAFSLKRQMDPATGSFWALWFQYVQDVSVTGPNEVTVSLTQPDYVFPEMMSTAAGAVVSEAYVTQAGSAYGTPNGGVMCSGPYSLESWKAGEGITLLANPDYWDTALQPKAERIEFTFNRDPSAVTNGLVTGAIDGSWEAPLAGFNQLAASSSGTLYRNPSTRCAYLAMSSFEGALGDPQIRQALQKSIDYDGIVSGLYHGTATPARSCAGPASWGYEQETFEKAYSELPGAVQDIDGAKAQVQAAGAPAQPIVLGYDAGDPTASAVVASIQDSAQQVGLTVELQGVPSAVYPTLFFDPEARAGLDAFFVTSTLDVPDPLEAYLQLVSSSPYNYTGAVDEVFDAAIAEALVTADPAARAQLVVEGQASVADAVLIMLPIATLDQLLSLKSGVTGPPVSTLSSLHYPWAATLGAAE